MSKECNEATKLMGIVIKKNEGVKSKTLPNFELDINWLLIREKMGCQDLTDEQQQILKAHHEIQTKMEDQSNE